jgi:CubicO group peptidase (beta-lactamase class C family)
VTVGDDRARVAEPVLVGMSGGDSLPWHPDSIARIEALTQISQWPTRGGRAVAAVVDADGADRSRGSYDERFPWASVTKVATALAVLVAVEESTLDLDAAAGPPGSTVRHLLAHTSGLPPDGETPIAKPGERRIYSNTGFEVLADVLGKAAKMPFERYLTEAVLRPLQMRATLEGSPASGLEGSLGDLVRLGRELLVPTLLADETMEEATSIQFPGLVGVLPGFGRQEPNDWGLGFELKDAKRPHWTGTRNSPRTFGHFGRSGTFLWVDPDAELAVACLTDLPFGDWAVEAWPRLADAVLAEARG